MTNIRRAFTMIEVIFVIVIVGILAAVAIPKLASNRDEATAKICDSEMAQLISKISVAYTASKDITDWKTKTVADVTNITAGVGAAGAQGIVEADSTIVDGATLTYNCGGEAIATISIAVDANHMYQLTVALTAPTSPVAQIAVDDLTALYGSTTKVFGL